MYHGPGAIRNEVETLSTPFKSNGRVLLSMSGKKQKVETLYSRHFHGRSAILYEADKSFYQKVGWAWLKLYSILVLENTSGAAMET